MFIEVVWVDEVSLSNDFLLNGEHFGTGPLKTNYIHNFSYKPLKLPLITVTYGLILGSV